MPFGCAVGWAQGTMYWMGVQIPTREGKFWGRKGAAPGRARWSIYSKGLSRGQHQYGADAEWGILDGVHIGATWWIRLNRPFAATMRPYVKLFWPLIIRLHRSTTYVDAACCHRQSSVVCTSVGRSVTFVSPAKTAEPIEMPFGIWTWVGPRKPVLGEGAHWRDLANTTEPSMCCGDQITLTTCY